MKLVRALFATRGPVVFVSSCGIRNLRVAKDFGMSVVNLAACERRKQKFVC